MSQWTFPVGLASGLKSLEMNDLVIHCSAEGSLIRIDVSNGSANAVGGDDPMLRVLEALHGLGFKVSSRDYKIHPLPAPWQSMVDYGSSPSSSMFDAAELCVELWLVSGDICDLEHVRDAIVNMDECLEANIREALAYWLLCSERELGGRNDLKRSWRSDTTDVLVMRTTERIRRRRPSEPLLAAAQSLLEELAAMRRLRSVTLSDYDLLETKLSALGSPLPLAFQQAIWWEAGYRLLELQQREASEEAIRRYRRSAEALLTILPGLTTLGLPGFGISIGQRAYYKGELPEALQAYIKEWNVEGQLHRQRLKRLFANVLTDLGQLEVARRLAEEGAREQEQAGDPETYKTLGRCGEIALRQGGVDRAIAYYERSLEFQVEKPADGQTLTYLGHAHLLGGKLEKADTYYKDAWEAETASGHFNAYILMGKIALAWRTGDRERVIQSAALLANTPRQEIIGDALPFAVIALAESFACGDNAKALEAHKNLLNDNYFIEGLAMLPKLFPKFESATKALNRIEDTLQRWKKALNDLPVDFQSTDSETQFPTPTRLLSLIAEVRRIKRWDVLEAFAARIYPVNLVLFANNEQCTGGGNYLVVS